MVVVFVPGLDFKESVGVLVLKIRQSGDDKMPC